MGGSGGRGGGERGGGEGGSYLEAGEGLHEEFLLPGVLGEEADGRAHVDVLRDLIGFADVAHAGQIVGVVGGVLTALLLLALAGTFAVRLERRPAADLELLTQGAEVEPDRRQGVTRVIVYPPPSPGTIRFTPTFGASWPLRPKSCNVAPVFLLMMTL